MWQRSGSALIIGIGLSVLIMVFSIQLTRTIIATKNNMERSIARETQKSTEQTRETKISVLQSAPELLPNIASYSDFRVPITVDDQTETVTIWRSTGCPVPEPAVLSEQIGLPISNYPNFLLLDEQYNEINRQSLADHCQTGGISSYFVYPAPLDCQSPPEDINANCLWQKVESNKSIALNLQLPDMPRPNPFNERQNLTVRVRPTCPANQKQCTETERYANFVEFQPLNPRIDTSDTVAIWLLDFISGTERTIVGSSKGRRTMDPFNELECDPQHGCRPVDLAGFGSTEITQQSVAEKRHLQLAYLGDSGLNPYEVISGDWLGAFANLANQNQGKLELEIINIHPNLAIEVQILSDQPLYPIFD